MKTFILLAASLAAFTSASGAFARDAQPGMAGGHYEWQSRPGFGPNKSALPTVRIWVKDASAQMASCDCAMMRDATTSADCMAMPHKGSTATHG